MHAKATGGQASRPSGLACSGSWTSLQKSRLLARITSCEQMCVREWAKRLLQSGPLLTATFATSPLRRRDALRPRLQLRARDRSAICVTGERADLRREKRSQGRAIHRFQPPEPNGPRARRSGRRRIDRGPNGPNGPCPCPCPSLALLSAAPAVLPQTCREYYCRNTQASTPRL